MSRSDEHPVEPTGDDEITTDVDTGWVATIRSELAGRGEAAEGDAADGVAADWREAEPAWDPEATVGASDGLIERIRREIDGTSPGAVPPPPPATTPIREARAVPPPAPIATDPVAPDLPPVPAVAGVDLDHAASTTVRWEPRQRLTTAAPVNDTAVIAPPASPGLDRTKVAIAIIVAVAVVLIVWLVAGSLGGDDSPAPAGSVPATGAVNSSDETGATGTTIATSDEGG